ncbi:Peptidoglycan-binding lysin domain-containing protein [Emticicia oligotrophica DSM 17448]|uniref:Peptidoglycan-binding lysin domain-containing protein n=1 Tax=Emticicia oligotrophica (strain DSM 17448 / CIP 109782 / MTCC 6937 / GPTSA100-15) TaxID=929562 RepID=A0ABN4AJA6_EMTOG|nr:peptidoglycan-binding protein LysM [Emticicia oligotrophica]AFK02028.1 Peptidoglycan-binding lysin domain-containing protein [Emticicia oligotrophica DSM 17448]
MGLMSFFKGVGEKLFGHKEEAAPVEQKEELKASALLAHVQKLGLSFNTLTVKTSGDTVTLVGEVDSQEDAEKIALAVGNVEGVHMVDNQLTVANPEPEAQFHTVEKGDTLSKIAKQYYGDMMKYPVIFEANKPMLKDPDLIYPGQVLRIPAL